MTEPEPTNKPDKLQSDYLLDEFISIKPGQPYRLLPFGRIVKNGRERLVTPELARKFKLPHWKPAIKLGSHREETPAGGHIVGLEVREDGLYAIPEQTERGAAALADGSYRYHSPEVMWEDSVLEHPVTGEKIKGPFIVGDALLHNPHLGEAAALYSVEIIGADNNTGETVMSDSMTVPVSFFDKILDKFGVQPEPPKPERQPDPEPTTQPDSEQYTALIASLEETQKAVEKYQAENERLQAENARKDRLVTLTATIQDADKYGSHFEGEAGRSAAEHLDGMSDETREWVLTQFRSMAAVAQQGAANLTGDIGNEGNSDSSRYDSPVQELNAVVVNAMKEHKVDYTAAFEIVRKENPDLVIKASQGGA